MYLTDTRHFPESLPNKIAIQNLAAGETLFAQENEVLNFYVVTSGRIKLLRHL